MSYGDEMKNKWIQSVLLTFFLILPITTIAQNSKKPNEAVLIKPYKMRQYNRIIEQLYSRNKKSHSPDITTRILADSSIFMGKPYHLGPLGEGYAGKFDKDPLYRTDEFDCVTFTETVLALVESNNFNQFREHILDIRYVDGLPSYLSRNHFTSVDWDPNNQQKGYITSYTKVLFPKTYKTAVTVINKPEWYASLKANNLKLFKELSLQQTKDLLVQLHTLGKRTKSEVSRLPYEPLTALYNKDGKPNLHRFAKIPSGVIIEIVRPNWNLKKLIGTNLNVSHLGLGVRKDGVLYYREASSLKHKVVDIPLEKYLAGYLKSPSVKGVSIQLINYPKKKSIS